MVMPGGKTRLRIGFKGKRQMPLFMIWREYFDPSGEMYYAEVVFKLL